MKGFLYYLVDGTPASASEICKGELAYAFAGLDVTSRRVLQRGVNNSAGVIFCQSGLESLCQYDPGGSQGFVQSVIRDDLFVGHTSTGIPSPGDLMRAEVIPGKAVKDDRGNVWEAPKAREYFCRDDGVPQYYLNLPTKKTLDRASRKWVNGDVKEAYRILWDLCCEYSEVVFDALAGTEEGPEVTSIRYEFPDDLLEQFTVEALKANYRVGTDEVALLDIIDNQFCQRVCEAVIDIDGYARMCKKKLALMNSSDSHSGLAVD